MGGVIKQFWEEALWKILISCLWICLREPEMCHDRIPVASAGRNHHCYFTAGAGIDDSGKKPLTWLKKMDIPILESG